MGHLDIPTVYVEYLDGSTEVVPLHPYAQHLAAKELARSRWRDPETGAPCFDDSDKTQVAAFFELRRLERVPEGDYFELAAARRRFGAAHERQRGRRRGRHGRGRACGRRASQAGERSARSGPGGIDGAAFAVADAALAAGFGLDLERCSAEVFAAVCVRLDEAAREKRREELLARYKETKA